MAPKKIFAKNNTNSDFLSGFVLFAFGGGKGIPACAAYPLDCPQDSPALRTNCQRQFSPYSNPLFFITKNTTESFDSVVFSVVEVRGFALAFFKASSVVSNLCFEKDFGQPLKICGATHIFLTLSFDSPSLYFSYKTKTVALATVFVLVEVRGFEPLAFALRTRRSTN